MTGINQGRPEAAIGEPIRFGDDLDFEIEQHPVSDRLIIRDTANGTVAYVRAERGGQIGGDGVLIKALKEGKPMADDGRTYDTIQQAERAANGWVFVPPGTFNESVSIDTEGLTLRGSGYNTLIDGGSGIAIENSDGVDGVTVKNICAQTDASGGGNTIVSRGATVMNTTVRSSGDTGISALADNPVVINNTVRNCSNFSIRPESSGSGGIFVGNNLSGAGRGGIDGFKHNNPIVANNITANDGTYGLDINNCNSSICVGNRVISAGDVGIRLKGSTDCIVANNRVSDSVNTDIEDNGTNTLLDGNLTGASN